MFSRRLVALAAAALAASAVAGCSEKIEAGAACPALCPQNQIPLQDTVLDAVAVDTTVSGYPSIGDETYLLLAALGDTLDTRVIVRYDTLTNHYRLTTATVDSTIRQVDSAAVRLVVDTLYGRVKTPVTIEVYDVGDTTVPDTVTAALLPYFTPDRLIGARTFAPESLVDSVSVPVSNLVVLNRITRGRPLRIGLRLRGAQSAALRFRSSNAGTGPTLRFRVSLDTSVSPVNVVPNSRTPSNPSLAFLQSALADYVIIAKGPPPPPPTLLAVGGMPAARVYLRFDIPSRIIDSARIVRASLLLTQVPNPASPGAGDSLFVQPLPLLAGRAITDVKTALNLASPPGTFGLDSTRVAPAGSGVREIQLVPLVQRWANLPTDLTPRALGLRADVEGIRGQQVLFYSTRADPAVRPRLRLTYVPHVTFGLP